MGERSTRIEHRVETRIPIRMRVQYEQLDDFLDDYASNISLGGMFIASSQPLIIGTRFRLRFRLPDRSRAIETYATVRWTVDPDPNNPSQQSGMGIQFDPLASPDLKIIEQWLTSSH